MCPYTVIYVFMFAPLHDISFHFAKCPTLEWKLCKHQFCSTHAALPPCAIHPHAASCATLKYCHRTAADKVTFWHFICVITPTLSSYKQQHKHMHTTHPSLCDNTRYAANPLTQHILLLPSLHALEFFCCHTSASAPTRCVSKFICSKLGSFPTICNTFSATPSSTNFAWHMRL